MESRCHNLWHSNAHKFGSTTMRHWFHLRAQLIYHCTLPLTHYVPLTLRPCLAHDQRQFLNISTSPTWTTTFPVAQSARVGTYTHTQARTVAHKCCPCGHRAKKPILAARIPARSNVWCILKQAPSAFLGAFARAARGAKGRRGGEPGARSVWSIGAGPELSSWSSCSIQVVVACN